MCKITNTIKFCTCINDNIDIDELDQYWVLHRFNKDKDECIMGLPMLPDHLHPMFKINADIISKALNTPEAFDKKIKFNNADRLEIVLGNNSDDDRRFSYTYEFSQGQWKSVESDCFELMNKYVEIKSGEIKDTV